MRYAAEVAGLPVVQLSLAHFTDSSDEAADKFVKELRECHYRLIRMNRVPFVLLIDEKGGCPAMGAGNDRQPSGPRWWSLVNMLRKGEVRPTDHFDHPLPLDKAIPIVLFEPDWGFVTDPG